MLCREETASTIFQMLLYIFPLLLYISDIFSKNILLV